jgi:hypothetical protein
MRLRLRSILFATACSAIGASPAAAALIPYEAGGALNHISQPSLSYPTRLPDFLVLGLPWSMTFNLDTEVPATPICNQTVGYYGAVKDTRLTLGNYTYTHALGDTFLNYYLPSGSCSHSGGAVDFYWVGNGWVPEGDAPFLAAFAFARVGGSLVFQFGAGDGGQFGAFFQPTPTPVPEPATCLLLGTGLAGIAWRRRRSARRRP